MCLTQEQVVKSINLLQYFPIKFLLHTAFPYDKIQMKDYQHYGYC